MLFRSSATKALLSRRVSAIASNESSRMKWQSQRLCPATSAFPSGLAVDSDIPVCSTASQRSYSSRTAFTRSLPLLMPIKTIEVMSLVGSTNKEAILKQILAPKGTHVMAGDVVAVLETSSSSSSSAESTSTSTVEIQAPSSGEIVDILFNLQDTVKLGDGLFQIDTDSESQATKDAKLLATHIQLKMSEPAGEDANKHESQQSAALSMIDEAWFQEAFLSLDDPQRLSQLAYTIRDRLPAPLLPKALTVLERVLQIYQENKSTTSATSVAQTATDIGLIYHRLGDLQAGITQLDFALKIRQEVLGEDHAQVWSSHMILGATYNQLQDYHSALPHFQRSLDIQMQKSKSNTGGAEGPTNLTISHHNVGATHFQTGNFDAALKEYLAALKIYETLHADGGDAAATTISLGDIASAHQNVSMAYKQVAATLSTTSPGSTAVIEDNFKNALDHAQKALQMRKEVQPHSPEVAGSHASLGQLYAEMGQIDAGKEQYEASLTVYKAVYGDMSPMTAAGYSNLGALQYQIQDFDAALASYEQGLKILKTVYDPKNVPSRGQQQQPAKMHPDVAAAYNNVGLALYQTGKFQESYDSHNEARIILEDMYGPDHSSLAITLGSLGNALKSLERLDESMQYFERAHKLLVEALNGNTDHPDVASSFNNIGLVLAQLGKWDEALQKYKSAQESFSRSLGDSHPHTGSCHFNIGLVHQEQGNLQKAAMEFELARLIWSSCLGPDHPQTKFAEQAKDEIDELLKSTDKEQK